LLRADPASDPRKLAQHAIEAGGARVSAAELVTLAREAADLNVANYAFGAAAEMYEVAARHAAGEEKIDLLIAQSDALRFRGRWQEARRALEQAASLARTLGLPGREAIALIHLERLTWSYGLDESEITQQIRDVIGRLPASETELRAQTQGALALRLSIATRQYENEQADLARAALRQLPSVTDRLARADIILGIRGGLQDSSSPEALLEYDQKLLDLGIELRSAYHIGEAIVARIIDLIRAGRPIELPSAVRAQRDFAEQSKAPFTIYSHALLNATLALARGDFEAAAAHNAEAARLSEAWGASMAQEALTAQAGWLLYETGEVDGLTDILTTLPQQDVSSLNDLVWALGAGLIHAEKGETEPASRILREVCKNTRDLRRLPRGPTRIGILATAAMVLGHPAVCDALPSHEASRIGTSIAELLTAHTDTLVLAGWPAVILGSKQRYIGLAYLAAGQPANAARRLTRAVEEDSEFAVLQARTQFDLARALLRQPVSHAEGLAEMKRVERRAAGLGMPRLAAQAAAALLSKSG
jgi:tetratricopeptide (TPR) repeat protein